MPPSSNHRKNAHTTQKKNTDSTPAKKTPPVTPNANPHNEDTTKSLTARIDMLEKKVLELEGVLEVTRNAKQPPLARSSQSSAIPTAHLHYCQWQPQ